MEDQQMDRESLLAPKEHAQLHNICLDAPFGSAVENATR